MKKLLIRLLIGLLSFFQFCYAQIKTKVDERFELTSITFALAGVPEYCQGSIPSYYQDMVEKLAKPYEFTEPINFVRELAQVYRIGYNAVSTAASLLEIQNGEIQLQSKYNISKISEFDSRWTEELFAKYIKVLNVFYKESDFHEFFKDHSELYKIAEQRMNEHIANTLIEWFQSFFGKPFDLDSITVYLSLTNGPNNYAIPDGVLIGMTSDSEGLPTPYGMVMFTLIHEIAHHYTNPLFDFHWKEMEVAANIIYPVVKVQMAKMSYGDARTTIGEWLNNLFVLMYSKETGNEWLKNEISQNIKNGFIWMQRSVDFMENFYINRDMYPYIKDFMLQLVSFLDFTAENIDFIKREYQFSQPYITNIYPAPGTDITNANEIIITFSEPMIGSTSFYGEPEGTEELWVDEFTWNDDKTQITLKLIPEKREPGHTYGIKLMPTGFISSKYFRLDEKSKDIIFRPKYLK